MTRDPQALWYPSPFCTEGRPEGAPRWIVLHGTAGGSSATNIAEWFRNPGAQVSSHYVIGQDGQIVQCVDEDDWAWANGVLDAGYDYWWGWYGNPNHVTISIEHVKSSSDNHDRLSEEQKRASFALIQRICDRWGIPKRPGDENGGILGHNSIAPINLADCPGPYPWDELWAFLGKKNEGDQKVGGIPNGWKDNGKELVAPNGIKVVRGFRDYILSHPWEAGNYPIETEVALSPVELSNPSLGNGTGQRFRWAALKWTASKGIYLSWIGQEEKYLREKLDSLQKQLKQLQDQLAAEKGKNHAAEVETLKQQLAQYQQAAKQALSALQPLAK